MSRTLAPASAVKDVTGPILAKQILGLLDELKIEVATFYGCSKENKFFTRIGLILPFQAPQEWELCLWWRSILKGSKVQ
jgi:hypothetical protein